MEHRLRRHDGEYRWVVTAGVPRYETDGSFAGYIGTGVDITERKLAEEALSTVSQKLIEAHEEERSRIARELHDDINQQAGGGERASRLPEAEPCGFGGGISRRRSETSAGRLRISSPIFRRCRTTFIPRDWNSWGWKRRRLACAKSCPNGTA
jgi:hypothetical protein